MSEPRFYGEAPHRVVVIHGGPGAPGEMAPVAWDIARYAGVIEPFQSAMSVDAQATELRQVLESCCASPATLIGYSWGAWLAFIVTARFPKLVKLLILVSAGPFDPAHALSAERTRTSRLPPDESAEYQRIVRQLQERKDCCPHNLLARLGELARRADSYDPDECGPEDRSTAAFQEDIFRAVWPEAAEMRRSGRLLRLAKEITCPVVAIHGSYDPHPVAGVREPLSALLTDFECIVLEKCGHTPWKERQARGDFFRLREHVMTKDRGSKMTGGKPSTRHS